MAIIKKGKIRGRIGKYIYRVVGDKEIVQSSPKKYELSENSKVESQHFGKASTLASSIYQPIKDFALNCLSPAFFRELLNLFRKLHRSEFWNIEETELSDWRLIPETDPLNINKVISLSDILRAYPTALFEDDQIILQIPMFEKELAKIKLPKEANFIEFTASILHNHSSLGTYFAHNYSSSLLSVHDTIPAQEIILPIEWPIKDLDCGIVVICFGLRFYTSLSSRRDLNTKDFNPTAILGIWHKNEKVINHKAEN